MPQCIAVCLGVLRSKYISICIIIIMFYIACLPVCSALYAFVYMIYFYKTSEYHSLGYEWKQISAGHRAFSRHLLRHSFDGYQYTMYHLTLLLLRHEVTYYTHTVHILYRSGILDSYQNERVRH